MKLNIQMLRALAALAVVLYHLGPHYRDAGGAFTLLAGIAEWGFFGVDVFFVISGFVISYTVLPRERDLAAAGVFLRHRLARIYLGYWPFGLLALFVIPVHSADNLAQVSTFHSLALTSADLAKLALPVTWSLSYELYFYALFGVLFCLSNQAIKRVMIGIFVLLLARVLLVEMDTASAWYFWVSAYLLEFLYGVLIYLFQSQLLNRRLVPLSVLLVVGGMFLGAGSQLQHDSRVLYFGISAAAIVLLALQLEENRWFVAPRWLVSLGDSSYALYLSHLFVITLFYQWGWRNFLANQPGAVREVGFLALLLGIVLLAHAWYRKVELPLYRWAIGRTYSRPRKAIPAGE